MMRPFLCAVVILSAALAGCAQKATVIEKSPALESAERLERRASAAYSKGDHAGAIKDYQVALQVYESLAMVDAQAGVQLSLARIDAQDGRVTKALERASWVLNPSRVSGGVSAATRLLANGRAAALHLQQHQLPQAKLALDHADGLCANTCDAVAALLTLRAQWLLASGNAASAEGLATQAMARAAHKSDLANAQRLRAQIGLALKNNTAAAADAQTALALDQAAGQAAKVVADLGLLMQAYEAQGDAAKVAQYRAQWQLAKQSLQALGQP